MSDLKIAGLVLMVVGIFSISLMLLINPGGNASASAMFIIAGNAMTFIDSRRDRK